MICPRCGNILDESETSCKNCGTKVTQAEIAADENQPIERNVTDVAPTPQQPVEEVPQDASQQVPLEQPVQPALEAVQYKEQYVQEQPVYQQQLVSNRGEKMNNKILIIAVALIVLVSVGIGVLMINKAQGTGANNIKAISDAEKNMDSDKIASSTQVEMYGYKLTIPSNYETKVENLMVYSVDYKNKVQLVFTIMRNVPFEELVASPEGFKSDLESLGFAVESYNDFRVEDRRWLVYSGTLSEKDSSYDALYAISAIGTDGSTFHVTIINVGAKTKNSVFAEIGDFLDKAEYTGRNMNGPSGGNSGSSGNGSGSGNAGTNPGEQSGNESGTGNNTNPGSVSA